MTRSRLLTRTAVSVTAGIALILGSAGAAHAAPTRSSCVTYKLQQWGFNQRLWAYNGCAQEVGFRVYRSGETSPCLTVQRGEWRGWQWPRIRKFHRVESC
ncbi:hypothetical protein AB0J83_23020 [Actinoplanes sp. NPDC049596]|uniref:hypothetical protein n=1 Tax=unclassified Actinoplanes TaxID=2626549 RepID=UPI003429FE7C